MAEAPSRVRQNYDWHCEDAVNTHIQLQLYASYVYMSMAVYFDRDDVALGNFKRFFLRKSHDCQASAEMFMHLQNTRGGYTTLLDIERPERDSWHGGFQAMECALDMEMLLNQSLLNMHKMAKERGDAHLCHFLKQNCLNQQVEVLKEVSGYLTNLSHMGAVEHNLAEHLFDKLSLS
ncbi:ferritin heavy polypeptide-like 17E [Arvicanthis niloticus]|uniref:ferritin heavy polypeptide-like 17E n=1 Tax=Arvicanthis niloticus TaxID=61156 RepID=UPI0014868FDB|nr:ferritin heavy polypeptide-like 17 [Arvicanthis niloticus]XP_034342185.1 ferritin heavy polypeptide-like 17 [Arvicanthis niloticus]XP_034342186.1 ferritin heavy polypeptide-like 17 [Arvicanthis niloticus]